MEIERVLNSKYCSLSQKLLLRGLPRTRVEGIVLNDAEAMTGNTVWTIWKPRAPQILRWS